MFIKKLQNLLNYFLIISVISLLSVSACSEQTPENKYTALIKQAQKDKENNKFLAAQKKLLNAIEIYPNDYQAYFELAEVQLNSTSGTDFSNAYNYYTTALNLNPNHRESRLRIASFLVLTNNPEQAETHIRKLLQKNPNDIDAQILDITLDSQRKNFITAKNKLNNLLTQNSNNPTVLATYANILLQEANTLEDKEVNISQAESYLLQALQHEPSNETIRIALAELYSNTGKILAAEELLKELIKNNPQNNRLRYYFAEFLLEAGKTEAALKEYLTIIENNPAFIQARDKVFDYYLSSKNEQKARDLVKDLETKFPNSPAVTYFQGRLLSLEYKLDLALEKYISAIKSLPDFAAAYRSAGLVELALNKPNEGLEHLRQAIAIDPVDIPARMALAQIALTEKKYDLALEQVNRILAKHPKQVGANIIRADIALLQDDTQTAETIYNALQAAFPDENKIYFKIALLKEKQNALPQALEYYKKYTVLSNDVLGLNRYIELYIIQNSSADVSQKISAGIKEVERLQTELKNVSQENFDFILSVLYRDKYIAGKEQKDLDESKNYLFKILKSKPEAVEVYTSLAQLAKLEGKPEEFIKNYQKIVEIQPQNINARLQIALFYEAQRNFTLAEKAYQEILNIAPQLPTAANNLAWLIAVELKGNLDEALKLALIAKQGAAQDPSVLDTLGWIYYLQGNYKEALEHIELAFNIEANNNLKSPEIMYHLAIIKTHLGQKDEAKKIADSALKLIDEKYPRYKELKALTK
ncbi:MAG: tetratricopeptide repeat protein [Deltaproteobacteria bacterium]|jgi:tetratricopeptide (TPR) repeat protein|nr:tetratricopeptide repeat protein [Deltaproteobacteria bacterium]